MNSPVAGLPQAQQDALTAFVEITQVSDMETSARFLEIFNWDVDAAVDSYLNTGFRFIQPQEEDHTLHAPARPQQIPQPIQRREQRQQAIVIPAFLRPLIAAISTASVNSTNPEGESRSFIAKYEGQYGQEHPQFFEGSYQQALAHANASHQLLFVYLQSPLHDDTDRFCRSVLNDPDVTAFLNRSFVVWAGSVANKDAYQLSMELQISTYPYCGVILYRSERERHLVERIEGMIDRASFMERLQNMIAAQSVQLRRIQQEAMRQAETTQLVQEQDREFLAAVEADRQRRMQEQEQAEEHRRREAELRRQQEEQQAREREHEQMIELKRARLAVEPTAPNAAQVRIQLPNGAKIDRKFLPSDQIQLVRDFIEIYLAANKINIRNFSISTNYPKRTLTDVGESVEAAGLAPRGVLYVQDLDA